MKRKMWIICITLVTLALAVTACAPLAQPQVVEREVMVEVERPAMAPQAAEGVLSSAADDLGSAADRMIIQTVNMSIVVQDTDKTLAAVSDLVAAYKGYVADSNRWLVNEQPYARITLRIPAASLEEVRRALRNEAIKVENESTSGQDVTEEFVDLQARIRNLEATETELLALLTEVRENRGKAEDILAIYRELTEIRSQIESLKGRSQYLERMTALATISLEIRPKEAPRPVIERARWNPVVTLSNALRGFVQVLQVGVDLLIYVLIFSPFVVVPVVVIWLLARAIRRRRARKG